MAAPRGSTHTPRHGDTASAIVALVQTVRVLLELCARRQVPAALGLYDEVQHLRLNLDVGAAGARGALLQADRGDLALPHCAVRLGEHGSRERLTLREAPAHAVGDVVLLAAEKVENRLDGATVERQLSHERQGIGACKRL